MSNVSVYICVFAYMAHQALVHMRFLVAELADHMSKHNHVLVAETLETTMDFKQKVSDAGVTTFDCLATRQGIEAPHSSVFKLGRGLTIQCVSSVHGCCGLHSNVSVLLRSYDGIERSDHRRHGSRWCLLLLQTMDGS